MNFFVDVIVPLPLDIVFTYRVNEIEHKFIKEGTRVVVPFGNSKLITSIVIKKHSQIPKSYKTKEIEFIIDDNPIINLKQIEFFRWISNYYMTPIGQVLKNALPSLLLLRSESEIILIKDDFENDIEISSESEIVLDYLKENKKISFDNLIHLVEKKNINKIVSELTQKSIVRLKDEIYDYYKSKKELRVYLKKSLAGNDFNEISEKLANKKSQLRLIEKIRFSKKESYLFKDLEKIGNVSRSTIENLIKSEIFEKKYIKVDRKQFELQEKLEDIKLSLDQNKTLTEIIKNFDKKNVCLLHGVTSSGKTEIYIKLIKKIIKNNQQVLYLVPEIALTTQLVERLKKFFSDSLCVYHSKYSLDHRTEIWKKVLKNEKKSSVILGTRSSIFLPFSNLGLIVVDEEHENAYKQFNSSPRYHARDSAIYLSSIYNCKILLGSATPSVESYYNAISKKYSLVELNKRFRNISLPKIVIKGLKKQKKSVFVSNNFSDELIQNIKICSENNNQVILFQNRRGYSPFLECIDCGLVYKCIHCDVSLTYHSYSNELKCHYCGYSEKSLIKCKKCSSKNLLKKGLGTQLVEEEIKTIFPELKIRRMDHDTTKSRNSFQTLIEDFEQNNFNVLVGTQMVTKGLDFKKVTLVGVINADTLIFFPSFRSEEKCYQMLTQVAGRAGRSGKGGKVIIQTYNPDQKIFKKIVNNNYKGMFDEQLNQRLLFDYPPYTRLIRISIKHKDFNKLNDGSIWVSKLLRKRLKHNILGPESPLIPKIKNKYIKQILIKIPINKSLKVSKATILKCLKSFQSISQFKSSDIIIDVDPYD